MVLGVPDAVLTQAVGLIAGFTIDLRPGRLDEAIVRVDVGDTDRQPAVRHGGATRGFHLVVRRSPMEPNGGIAVADLGVDDRAVVEPVQSARGEAERLDQEVVGRLNVLVDEDGDDRRRGGVRSGLRSGHSSMHCAPFVVRCTPRAPRCWTGTMLETPEEMADLQALLDASMAPPAPTCATSSPTSAGSPPCT